jgi:hypothetical protein
LRHAWYMPQATALFIPASGPLNWISQTSAKFYGRVAYYDDYSG